MIDELVNIDDYKELKILDSSELYNFIVILIIVVLFLIFIVFNFNFECYYKNNAIYNNDEISLVVKVSDLKYITDNSIIVINDKNYKYKVKNIDTAITNDNGYYIQNVVINVYGFESIDNNIIEFKILYDTKNGFKIIKDFILGEGI